MAGVLLGVSTRHIIKKNFVIGSKVVIYGTLFDEVLWYRTIAF